MTDLSIVESIFFAALGKSSPQERAEYLDAACGDDVELRRHVERILAARPMAGNFLDGPAPGMDARVEEVPVGEGPGTVIGPYKLMEQIGEGGMGLVFVAEQQYPVRRKVAVKIIKPGMGTRDVIARFEAERQALALMDHPNIARVFEAGATEGGRPYFVMELVKGISIVEYCDQQQLTAGERLELFLSVCQAVQHAHGKGVIHRDLKPSNILVAPHDGIPVVKVIDFGVAKALGQQLTDKTVYTRFTQMIGTPLYMSPEQAEINALDVDIRSDVYSLGVLLYELLTGTTPFDRQRFVTAAYDEIRRIIREEEPPKPSTRLSTLGAGLSAVSARRKTEPAKLSALVKGDLDWMVMKALEKDRGRRYETASAFAADVRRFLNQEPIEARPPSVWYRSCKLAQRNKVALTTVALVAVALVLGTVVSVWQALRAHAAERLALENAEIAREQEQHADDAKQKAEKQRDEFAALNETLRRANYIADMNLALHAWEENNMMRARELLDRHRPKPDETDLRGFEWHYLRRLFHRDRLTVNAHAGYALMVAFLPDGKRLISHGTSQRPPAGEFNNSLPGELKLWDATTGGRLPLQLKGPTDNVACAALSPDGKQLAAGYADKTVRVWDLDTNEGIALGDHHGAIFRVQFSPDGRHLVSVAADTNRPISLSEIPPSELKVWDLATRKAIITRANLPFVSLPPAFSPDGKLLACRSTIGGVIWVWDAATGQELHAFKDVPAGPSAVAFSPKGQRLAAGEYALKLWDVTTGSKDISHQLVSPAGACLAFSPDGKRLATTTFDGLLELWDSATGRRLRTFKGHAGLVESLAFSPDGRSLASAGADGTLKVWDTTGESEAIPIPGATTTPEGGLWLSHDGQKAVTGFQSKTIQVWDAATGKPRCASLEHEHRVTNMDSTSDGKWLALADAGKNVKLWDMDTGRAIRTFQGHAEAISDLAISREGKWIAVWCKGGTLNLWDVEKGTDPRTIEGLRDDLGSGGFGPEGARLVGTSFKGAIRVVDVPTGRVALSLRLNDLVILISTLSPDGKRLAVTGFVPGFLTGEVRILDAASGREVMPRLRGHNFGVRALAFSPDGLRLATGSGDKTVKIWDMTSGQETLTLKGHTDQINSIAFSPDGRRLISASWDHTVRVWDATPLPDE